MKALNLTRIKQYYLLTKPGIVYGNALTATGGLLFASTSNYDFIKIIWCLFFICLVMAGACALNNAMDVEIDSKMDRTKIRPTVTKDISKQKAFIFGLILSIIGLMMLLIISNILTFVLGLIALITYTPLYTVLKKQTWLATWVGAVPGALPPVAGYTAITDQFDANAVFIFMTMFVWQLAHFYGIALYRREQYKKASVPVVSVIKGEDYTQKMILAFIISYIFLMPFFWYVAGVSAIFAFVMIIISDWWLRFGLVNYKKLEPAKWGSQMFFISLKVLVVYSVGLALAGLLP